MILIIVYSYNIVFSQCEEFNKEIANQINFEHSKLSLLLDKPDENNYRTRGIGRYAINKIYTPKLFANNLNLENIFNEVNHFLASEQANDNVYDQWYNQHLYKLWALALFDVAAQLNQYEFEYGSSISELAYEISVSGVIELSGIKDIRPNQMKDIQRIYRDITGQSKYTRLDLQASKIANIVAVFSAAVSTIESLDQYQKSEILAKIILNSNTIITDIKQTILSTDLYRNDAILRGFYDDFENMDKYYHDENLLNTTKDIFANGLSLVSTFFVTPTIVSSLSLAGPEGILAGLAIGIVIDAGIFLFREGEVYLLKYSTASLLYTLAFDLISKNYVKNSVTIASFIHIANSNIDKYVLGKLGKFAQLNFSNAPAFIEDFVESSKWDKYLQEYYHKKYIIIKISSDEGRLIEPVNKYIKCKTQQEALNEKIDYINRKSQDYRDFQLLFWICSIISFFIAVGFILSMFSALIHTSWKATINSIRNLAITIFSEAFILAIVLNLLFGLKLGSTFKATLGIMSYQVINSTRYISKEIFGKEIFVNESIEAVYYIYKQIDDSQNK